MLVRPFRPYLGGSNSPVRRGLGRKTRRRDANGWGDAHDLGIDVGESDAGETVDRVWAVDGCTRECSESGICAECVWAEACASSLSFSRVRLLTLAFQATISTDSYLRIYTCLSPSLDDWQLTNTVSLPSLQSSHNAKSAPTDDAPHPAGPTGVGAGLTLTGAPSQSSVNAPNPGKGNEALGGWCLSWCKERWWGQILAATSGHSGIIKVSPLDNSHHSFAKCLFP